MTDYIILTKKDGTWREYENRVSAASTKAALKSFLDGEDPTGEYVAVPARSWQPVKVSVEQSLKFS